MNSFLKFPLKWIWIYIPSMRKKYYSYRSFGLTIFTLIWNFFNWKKTVMVNKLRPFKETDRQTNFKKIHVNLTHSFDLQFQNENLRKSCFTGLMQNLRRKFCFTGLMPSTTSLYVILKSIDCRRGLIRLISEIWNLHSKLWVQCVC